MQIKLPWNLNRARKKDELTHPFWVMVQKEVGDHMRSWRYNILLILMVLTCVGSLYTAMSTIRTAVTSGQADNTFLFLNLFTVSDPEGTLPPFITFISFLGPLLGIGLGFDAINSERNKGTLSRLMSQPIPRDYVINAKFAGALLVIAAMFFALWFLVMGFGIIATGIPPTPEEFLRMFFFVVLSIFYVAFWLNLSILFSVRFRQAATSALSAIAVWLFFSVFFSLLIDLIAKALAPKAATEEAVLSYFTLIQNLMRISPAQLFNEATMTLLTPSVRTLGIWTMDQRIGALPTPLPLDQSLLLVWPQMTGLIAATLICFAVSYVMFMRQEIRSR